MNPPSGRHVVITGVSSGIGRAAAEHLAGRGYHVFGSVRRAGDAAGLKEALGQAFTPLEFDVTDADGVRDAADQVSACIGSSTLAGLVNNAGIAMGAPLQHQALAEIRQHFEVNVLGLLSVTQAFLPLLGAVDDRQGSPGRIVNVGSVAGRVAVPFLGAYAASKHAVEALSDVLRRELAVHGIEVILIQPGAVRTPIWDKAERQDFSRYLGTAYQEPGRKARQFMLAEGRRGLDPSLVGRAIGSALEDRRPRVRHAVLGRSFRDWILPRCLPDRWLDKALTMQFGLQKTLEK